MAAGASHCLAAGITVPAGSSVNVNSGALNVAGDVSNSGTIVSTSGTVSLTGNWANSGTFTAGSGTVNFTGGVGITQTLNSGGIGAGKLFYHLTHSGAGTLQLVTNAVDIDGNFNNSAGIFDANGKAISCAGNWANSATYTHNNNSVTLDGASQSFTGSTTFYSLSKSVTSAATLTFDNTATQAAVNSLALSGASGQLLSLRSDAAAAYNLTLQAGGTQSLSYLDVQYSDASGGVKLIGGATSTNSGNNTNWSFNGATITWDGSSSADWDTAANWDLGIVPRSTDSVIIPNVTTDPVISNSNVTIVDLTVQAGGLVTLNSKNLTLSGALDCDGTITITNNETLKLGGNADWTNGVFNKASGTAQWTANANLTSAANKFNNFTIDTGVTVTAQDKVEIDGTLTTTGTGALNLNSQDLQIATSLNLSTQTITNITNNTVTFDAPSGAQSITSNANSFNNAVFNDAGGTATFQLADAMDVNANFTLTDGIFDQNSKTLNVGGNWSFSGGSFAANPNVTFDTAATAIISGSTTFNNFACATAGKQLTFTAGTTQTIAGALTLTGTSASKVILRSSSSGSIWTITDSGTENVSFADVKDSTAANSITAYNSTNSGNNTNWVFNNLSITYPSSGKTVGQTPTVIGVSGASETVVIKDISGNTVATTTADASGNWRVAVSTSLVVGANSLTPYAGSVAGNGVNITVAASPTTDQVPVITSPAAGVAVRGNKPTITGSGLAGQTVTLTAKDANGNLLLTDVAQATVGADGTYTISSANYTTNLVKGTDYLTVTVDGVASGIREISLVDPFGVVFDSVSNNPIKGAVISLYYDNDPGAGRNWILAVPGTQIAASDANPQTTIADGAYSYLCINGDYYTSLSASGYNYPSDKTSFPSGRVIVTGSKGEVFTVAGAVIEMDHPMDSNDLLLKVRKSANKKDVTVGDIITYTVIIQNPTTGDVTNVYLEDKIPVGFKYLSGKAILDNQAIPDPSGSRPISFNIGTVSAGTTRTLKYQLVVGSGVSFGNYDNTAWAKYSEGTVISNRSSVTIKIVPDPVFDLGTVLGKVFQDENENGVQDKGEEPLPNTQIVTEEGTVITSDSDGRFHLQAIIPGRHLFRLDERNLPEGAYLTTDKAVIVDITRGILAKVNFGVKLPAGSDSSSISITHDRNKPQPRLNAACYALDNGYEFRIFTNYSLFIEKWKLEVLDKDTQGLIKRFAGTRLTINEPILWGGDAPAIANLSSDRNYIYVLTVTGKDGRQDATKEKKLAAISSQLSEEAKSKTKEEIEKEKQKWLEQESGANNLGKQNIGIEGEAVKIQMPKSKIQNIRILKSGSLEGEIPLAQSQGITPSEILESPQSLERPQSEMTADIILPKGEYDIEVQSAVIANPNEVRGKQSQEIASVAPAGLPRNDTQSVYSQRVKVVGEDYLFFVGMGDAKAGYTFNRGNIEPAGSDDKFREGFWGEGKLAYYLKGKIKGKYLITSSLDTERDKKELFRNLDPDRYYPVYGDGASVNYSAANTQGPLYLLIEWDKSKVLWGDYETGFTDTEFAQFSRTLYGGKLYYESVSLTQFGEPKTKLILFRARAKQRAAHNEFLGTGGSLFYLKNEDVVEGSDKVKIEVRDKVTGLVLAVKEMESGVDYEIKYPPGRIIFWKPVARIIESDSIISSQLLDGNQVYLIVDYEYETKDKYDETSYGARAQQSLTDYLRIGGTYIKEGQLAKNYELRAADAVIHLGKDIAFSGEYAESDSQQIGSFTSTDGGLSFTELATGEADKGKAYGIKGEGRFLGRLGVAAYYKQIEKGFSSAATVSQQGKELMGAAATLDITAKTRLKVSHDIQKLIDDGNLQTQAQVGAQKTETTSVQLQQEVVTDKLKLTAEYRKQQVKEKKEPFESETNVESNIAAVKADYQATKKTALSLEQQVSLSGAPNQQTTLGIEHRPNQWLSLRGKETVGNQGSATNVGASVNLKDKFELSGDLSRANVITGEISNTLSLGGKAKVDDKTELRATVAVTDDSLIGRTESFTLGSKHKINDGLSLTTDKTYAKTGDQLTQADTYGLAKEKDGRKIEGSFTEQKTRSAAEISRTNIFGLSGDINDYWAALASYERGVVQNLDGTRALRNAGSFGLGFVNKDKEAGYVKFKASSKLELRWDNGQENKRQIVSYNAAQGRINPDTTIFAKANLSQSQNTTADTDEAKYKELVAGAAFRPVKFDRLNLLAKYTYLEDDSPSGQVSFKDLEKQKSHTFSAEAVYDLTDKWQLVEKLAYKMADEKISGFDFTKTQTWLAIQRVNYNFNRDWQVGGEYRRLTQVQAKDYNQGVMVEVARKIGEFIQLGVGYNFTNFNDDLTHLNYTAQGPFIRLTGRFFDRTPEEIERSRKIWLENMIKIWAWELVNEELAKPDSPVMREICRLYLEAKKFESQGKLKQAKEYYQKSLQIGEIMYNEAQEYIRGRVELEERIKKENQIALEYFRQGNTSKAKQLWQKIKIEAKPAPIDLSRCF